MLIVDVNPIVASNVVEYSRNKNNYSLLAAVLFKNIEFGDKHTISLNGSTDTEVLQFLSDMSSDQQDNVDLEPEDNSKGIRTWCVPNSDLTVLTELDDQIEELRHLITEINNFIQISKVENIIWSLQYELKKKNMEDRIGHSQHEKILYFGCTEYIARSICNNGFSKEDTIHGKFL